MNRQVVKRILGIGFLLAVLAAGLPAYQPSEQLLAAEAEKASDATGVVQSFADIPPSHWAYTYIEKLYAGGITAGCGGGFFCPDAPVTRAQMAVFLERAMKGGLYEPPKAQGIFADLSGSHWAADWVEQLLHDGITTGCSAQPPQYCPEQLVTRAETD